VILGAILWLCLGSVAAGGRGQKEVSGDCFDCSTIENESAPEYHIARQLRTTKDELLVNISIDKKHLSHPAMLRLACRLNRDFAKERSILVQIFNNKKAAKRWVGAWEPEKPADWPVYEVALYGRYMRDDKGRSHSLTWYPNPLNKVDSVVTHLCPQLGKSSDRPHEQ
jgi:hypothetical protein